MKFCIITFIYLIAIHFAAYSCNCIQWCLEIGSYCCKQDDSSNADHSQSPHNFQHGKYIFVGDKMQPVTPGSLSAQILTANARFKPISFGKKPAPPNMQSKETQH